MAVPDFGGLMRIQPPARQRAKAAAAIIACCGLGISAAPNMHVQRQAGLYRKRNFGGSAFIFF